MYKHMTTMIAGALLTGLAGAAAAQPNGAGYIQVWHEDGQRRPSWDYCAKLINLYDRYTASRSESSDGAHSHVRIGAEIECHKGDCDYCATTTHARLKMKKVNPPAPPTNLGLAM